MIIKNYKVLPEEAKYIRQTVFVEEQGFQEEFDSVDTIATHIVAFDEDKPVATGRFYFDDAKQTYFIGRLAVMKDYRGRGLGAVIIKEAEGLVKTMGGKSIILHSQCQAQGFYEKQGYYAYGDVDYDEDCPHIWMKKDL
ncbi:MAG: GNAT family N-acetyltransferase [Clostridium sp.]|nr:GNAT family N-acetyltransferase [Clostridium sp.]